MSRLLDVLPGERRVASRLMALMVTVWAGVAIGGNAIEGLLFARVGPDALPYLFVALGASAAAAMVSMNALLARPRPQTLLLRCFPVAAAAALAIRALLLVRQDWVYPIAWLTMMVLWIGANVVTWGIAGAVHDTRQAKRLFPLYASGVILGTAVGGLATAPLARWLGAENLLFVWAAALGGAGMVARSSVRSVRAPISSMATRRSSIPFRVGMSEGWQVVRTSPLLSLMGVLIVLFAVLYFTLALLFARSATARFPDADELAGFLGTFIGAASATGLLVSLFAANRLGRRFGVAALVLALSVVYLFAFAALALSSSFLPLVVLRFLQMVWITGIWAGAWQALYNVIPSDRRERTRAVVDGVAYQGGVVVAGVVLILANTVQEPRVVVLLGLLFAGVAAIAALKLRRAYAREVLAALRAGNPEVFVVEAEPLAVMGRDGAVMSVVTGAASDPEPGVRRMAVEVLGDVGDDGARSVLERAVVDEDPSVRAAALRGLARTRRLEAAGGDLYAMAAAMLRDDEAAVRLAAVEALPAPVGEREQAALRPLLSDGDAGVRARAAVRLLESPSGEEARALLFAMAASEDASSRAEAIAALSTTGQGVEVAAAAIADPDPVVRRAALSALEGRAEEQALAGLVCALGDADGGIREEAIEAVVRTGTASIPALQEAAARPELEPAAMRALVRLDAVQGPELDDYLRRKISIAARYAALLEAVGENGDAELDLLAHGLRHASRRHAEDALLVASATWEPRTAEAVDVAIENLEARDPAQRANAIEMLEAAGEPEIVRPLMAVWEGRNGQKRQPREALAQLMEAPDPWVRATAAFAAGAEPGLRPVVEKLAGADPDTFVRGAARAALGREATLGTPSGLPVMERMIFFRRVSLFRDLAPDDLKHVAEVSTEHSFSDGDVIATEGDPGEEMHVVVSGEIRVLIGRDGEAPIEVARRTSGECVGEMAVVSRAPRMASLTARGEVRTLTIDRRRFERILRERPEASLAVMAVLCDRLRELHGSEPLEARS